MVVRVHHQKLIAFALLCVASLLMVGWPTIDEAHADTKRGRGQARCAKQRPQSFLIRGNYLPRGNLSPAEIRRRTAMHQRSLRYRTEHYGYVEGYGPRDANPHPVTHYLEHSTFWGLPIHAHKRMMPALRCVEAELRRSCRSTPYEPKAIGGYRDHNTYRQGEVTNHLYGIAIDIDPQLNPCCGCVDPWPSNPRCQGTGKTAYERMAMPACWVRVFEQYGFYWLGHDVLEDTMHFEFLGDPSKVR